MGHTQCRLGKLYRGYPSIGFYKDGKPQYYCLGRMDAETEEPLPECKECPDWVYGEQCEEDFQKARCGK